MAAFKRNALTFGITFCISFLIFGIIAYIILSTFLGPAEKKNSADAETENDMIIGFEDALGIDESAGNSFTALLVGTDYQPKVTPDAPSRADTIILVRFSCETETVIYMNIPAVTQITVDGNATTLSKAYTDKGIEYLMEKIQGMTGLQINYYAIASVAIFDDLINTLGGVNYPVPVNMEYEDKEQNLKIDLKKGTQDLDGSDTIDMLRYCSDSYSDRMLRNVQFLRSMVEKYTQSSYKGDATQLYSSVFEYLVSNFEEDDLIKYMDTIYSYSSYEGKVLTFPGDFKADGKETYFSADTAEAIEMLAEYKNY